MTGIQGVAPTPGTSARVSRSRSFKESSKDEVSGCHRSVVTLTHKTKSCFEVNTDDMTVNFIVIILTLKFEMLFVREVNIFEMS